MSKKYLFLCLIALIVISGCVDKIQTQIQAGKAGWNQAKYEEYSKYYDEVICIHTGYNSQCRPLPYSNAQSLAFETKDMLFDMRSDESEFERTWYMAFSNLQNGLELKARAEDFGCYGGKVMDPNPDKANIDSCSKRNKLLLESKTYFNKSLEYRQKIEEMKPN